MKRRGISLKDLHPTAAGGRSQKCGQCPKFKRWCTVLAKPVNANTGVCEYGRRLIASQAVMKCLKKKKDNLRGKDAAEQEKTRRPKNGKQNKELEQEAWRSVL